MKNERTTAAVDAVILAAIDFERERAALLKNGNYQIPESTAALCEAVQELHKAAMADALEVWKTAKEIKP